MSELVKRNFIIGDNWVYFKIYTGYNLSDSILLVDLRIVIEKLKKLGVISKWFYIRYADPEYHLRVRFFVENKEDVFLVISKMNAQFKWHIDEGVIWRYQMDTYEREIERYGNQVITESETLFYYDSELVLKLVGLVEEYQSENLRWLLAIMSIDFYLDCFGLPEENKINFTKVSRDSLNKIYSGEHKSLTPQLNKKYQLKKEVIKEFLNSNIFQGNHLTSIKEIFSDKRIEHVTKRIIIKNGDKNTEISSYIHMCLNRLFKTRNTFNEYISYDFLYRYYMSEKYAKKDK